LRRPAVLVGGTAPKKGKKKESSAVQPLRRAKRKKKEGLKGLRRAKRKKKEGGMIDRVW
jgi:hypothetical protein